MNPFKNKKIRSCYDKTSNKRWFSVVDVCAALRDCDYTTARNYWKWLKRKLYAEKKQPVSERTNQLQMQALDGKLRYTDVMDAEEILMLIEYCPSPKVGAFKLWIMSLSNEGKEVAKCVEQAMDTVKDTVRCKVGNLLKTLRRKEFDVLAEYGCDGVQSDVLVAA